jgi:hypothetical protein
MNRWPSNLKRLRTPAVMRAATSRSIAGRLEGSSRAGRRSSKKVTSLPPAAETAVEHGTVDATPAAPTFERFVREQYVPLVMPGYTPATRERYERLLWKDGVITALGSKPLNEIGAREFRALDAAVRGRGVNPRQHLIIVRRVLKRSHTTSCRRRRARTSVPCQWRRC